MKVGTSFLAALVASRALAYSFTYTRDQFLIDDEPIQIIGGEVQPQRVPRELWTDRLGKARAMGLNTVFTYVFWNSLEPQPGEWDFDGQNDIAAWFQAVQDAGLYAVLRPGPYVCGEWEWGGLPGWLNNIGNLTVRHNNPQFLEASANYMARLGEELHDYQASQGGPMLMVQVENEYGHFGDDMDYKVAIANQIQAAFDLVPYTNDAGQEGPLLRGYIPGILALTDGQDPKVSFEARDKYITDASSLGPLLNGEFYVWWFSSWGPNSQYWNMVDDDDRRAKFLSDTKWTLDGGNSFNLFMWHGGTNWGFMNGALRFGDGLQAFTTSYDYGSPLDESGRPTKLFHELRDLISNYVPKDTIPGIPETPSLQSIPSFALTPARALFDDLCLFRNSTSVSPASMESLESYLGYILYETTITKAVSGIILSGDQPRDRVIVYINGTRQGVIDRIHKTVNTLEIEVSEGDLLQLFVENLGRVDFMSAMIDQVKGIVGDVTIGSNVIENWTHYSIPLDSIPETVAGSETEVATDDGTPVWYKGTIHNHHHGSAADTFLSLSGIKGVVWVNGHNLGRYWMVGPQQSLYVPGTLLHKGKNELIVLDLEPTAGDLTAEGLSERLWFNQDDPDCGVCKYRPPGTAP